jgi:hypothetical protein
MDMVRQEILLLLLAIILLVAVVAVEGLELAAVLAVLVVEVLALQRAQELLAQTQAVVAEVVVTPHQLMDKAAQAAPALLS